MDDAELVKQAEKVIRGNRKPTVILSQAEAEALIAERDAVRDAVHDLVTQVGFALNDGCILAPHDGNIAVLHEAAIRALKGKSHE